MTLRYVKEDLDATGLYKQLVTRRYVYEDLDVDSDSAAFYIVRYVLVKFVYSRRRAPIR